MLNRIERLYKCQNTLHELSTMPTLFQHVTFLPVVWKPQLFEAFHVNCFFAFEQRALFIITGMPVKFRSFSTPVYTALSPWSVIHRKGSRVCENKFLRFAPVIPEDRVAQWLRGSGVMPGWYQSHIHFQFGSVSIFQRWQNPIGRQYTCPVQFP